jgi:Concanavalin A-like lectin/glucanases superfamily
MSAYSDKILADNPSAYWRLSESSGTTANDSVGTAHGVISGGVTLGQNGALADGDKAMLFDGTTGKIGPMLSTALLAPVTVEAWIKPTTLPGQAQVCGTYSGLSGTKYIGTNGTKLFVFMDTATPPSVLSTANISTGIWQHIVWIITGTETRFYINGVAGGTVAQTVGTQSTYNLWIGCADGGAEFWPGALDEVAIYPTALTAPQIAAHYEARNFTAGAGFSGIPWWMPLDEEDVAVPYNLWTQITPHDSNDIPGGVTDAILVGGAGDVAAVMQNNQVVVLRGLPGGAWVPIAARRVNATGTTATNLSALYQQ